MKTILYPVIFTPEDVGYSTYIPDVKGCISEGDTIEEAYANTFDALGLCLEDLAANNIEYPLPSNPGKIKLEEGEFVAFVEFDAVKYAKKHDTKAVKKTLTIPSWLNALAEEEHVNFSGVLQSALKKQLNID